MSFIDDFQIVVQDAASIVLNRDAEGRNAAVAVKDQFESTTFVIDLIRMKCQRAKSYLAAGNFAKFKEEMQDCLNYSAFCVVFEQPEPGHTDTLDDAGGHTIGFNAGADRTLVASVDELGVALFARYATVEERPYGPGPQWAQDAEAIVTWLGRHPRR